MGNNRDLSNIVMTSKEMHLLKTILELNKDRPLVIYQAMNIMAQFTKDLPNPRTVLATEHYNKYMGYVREYGEIIGSPNLDILVRVMKQEEDDN